MEALRSGRRYKKNKQEAEQVMVLVAVNLGHKVGTVPEKSNEACGEGTVPESKREATLKAIRRARKAITRSTKTISSVVRYLGPVVGSSRMKGKWGTLKEFRPYFPALRICENLSKAKRTKNKIRNKVEPFG